MNNTGTKYDRIKKQTAFKKNGEYTPCLKYSVPIFVEQIYELQLWRLAVRGGPGYVMDHPEFGSRP